MKNPKKRSILLILLSYPISILLSVFLNLLLLLIQMALVKLGSPESHMWEMVPTLVYSISIPAFMFSIDLAAVLWFFHKKE